MTADQAVAAVDARRQPLGISPAMQLASTERAIVAYQPDPESATPPEDRIAWIVILSSALGYVRVDVDDRNGEVLDVQRSA